MTTARTPCDPTRAPLDARTVLIVDADPRGAALLETSLQRAGYLASVVNSADEAIVRLEEEVVDLVICDTVLSGHESGASDGFALLAVIRAHPRLSVPVIILSSSSAVTDKVRGLELGAEDFLCKPLAVQELLVRVRVLFARRAEKAIPTAPLSPRVLPLDDDSTSHWIIPLPLTPALTPALAPAQLRERPLWSSVPPAPEAARRWKIRMAVFSVLALVAGFALVALLRGCSRLVP